MKDAMQQSGKSDARQSQDSGYVSYFQGWTRSEIAEGCQIPLGTVKARMRLGLIRLKKRLEEMGIREM